MRGGGGGDRIRAGGAGGGCGGVGDREHRADGGFVPGEGAGLVEGDVADLAETLERGAGLHHHAEATGRADGGNGRHRNGNGQGAGRRGDEHHQRPLNPRARVAENGTDGGDRHREDEHPGDERPGDAIGDAGAAALVVLRALDEGDDLGQRIARTWCRRAGLDGVAGVDGAREESTALVHRDRDGFTGDGGRVDGGGGPQQRRVGGNSLAGADEQDVAGDDVVDRDVTVRFPAATGVFHERRVLREQLQQ